MQTVKAEVQVFLGEKDIEARVQELADEISRDYAGMDVMLVCTLGGAVFFLADLARLLKIPVQIEYVKASSYGDGTDSSKNVRLEYTPGDRIKGKHVLWVEDIVDTGRTYAHLERHLRAQEPASLKLVSLLDKPSRREWNDVKIDYLGFTIPDKFVVGYGLDFAGNYRNLPYIGVLKQT